jgi:hypothetical protein
MVESGDVSFQHMIVEGFASATIPLLPQFSKIGMIFGADVGHIDHEHPTVVQIGWHDKVLVRRHNQAKVFLGHKDIDPLGLDRHVALGYEVLEDARVPPFVPVQGLVGEHDQFVHQVTIESANKVLRVGYGDEVVAHDLADGLDEEVFADPLPPPENDADLGCLPWLLVEVGNRIQNPFVDLFVAVADYVPDEVEELSALARNGRD